METDIYKKNLGEKKLNPLEKKRVKDVLYKVAQEKDVFINRESLRDFRTRLQRSISKLYTNKVVSIPLEVEIPLLDGNEEEWTEAIRKAEVPKITLSRRSNIKISNRGGNFSFQKHDGKAMGHSDVKCDWCTYKLLSYYVETIERFKNAGLVEESFPLLCCNCFRLYDSVMSWEQWLKDGKSAPCGHCGKELNNWWSDLKKGNNALHSKCKCGYTTTIVYNTEKKTFSFRTLKTNQKPIRGRGQPTFF